MYIIYCVHPTVILSYVSYIACIELSVKVFRVSLAGKLAARDLFLFPQLSVIALKKKSGFR